MYQVTRHIKMGCCFNENTVSSFTSRIAVLDFKQNAALCLTFSRLMTYIYVVPHR